MIGQYVVAVDGPAGVGKTSVSRGVASRMQCAHLDTGAYYRAATLVALVSRVDLTIEAEVLAVVAAAELEYGETTMAVEGVDMSTAIRCSAVTAAVSQVSAYPSVRTNLVARQRAWVEANGDCAVVEGRDIGTVVFSDSPLKVYLTASPEVRAERRAGERAGNNVADVQQDLARRDTTDSTRAASPLAAASDAVILDTSKLTLDEVIGSVLELARDRGLTS